MTVYGSAEGALRNNMSVEKLSKFQVMFNKKPRQKRGFLNFTGEEDQSSFFSGAISLPVS